MNKHHISESGFGIIEVIIASALLIILSVGAATYLTQTSQQSMVLEKRSECMGFVQTVVNSIKSGDHVSAVRNWSPSATQGWNTPYLNSDPICKTKDNLGCDNQALVVMGVPVQKRNFLNLRDVATWAENLYNRKVNATSNCSVSYFIRPAGQSDLGLSDLPQILDLPNNLTSLELQIKAVGVADCSSPIPTMWPTSNISFNIKAIGNISNQPSCQAEIIVSHEIDKTAPIFKVVIYNGLGNTTTQNRNLCYPGATTTDVRKSAKILFKADEPGCLFTCRTDPAGPELYCDGLQLNGVQGKLTNAMTTEVATAKVPTMATLEYQFNGPLPFGNYFFYPQTTDSGGNISTDPKMLDGFIVQPICPIDPTVYCPGQEPLDGCGEFCPVGQRPSNCASLLPLTCPTVDVFDSCGRGCGKGKKPTPVCAPGPYCSKDLPIVDSSGCNGVCPQGPLKPIGATCAISRCSYVADGTDSCGRACNTPAIPLGRNCPASNTYCPNVDATDICGIAACAVGTKVCTPPPGPPPPPPPSPPVCTCPTAPACIGVTILDSCNKPCSTGGITANCDSAINFCKNRSVTDKSGCNNDCGMGSQVGTGCKLASDVCVGAPTVPVYDTCGEACPAGAKVCNCVAFKIVVEPRAPKGCWDSNAPPPPDDCAGFVSERCDGPTPDCNQKGMTQCKSWKLDPLNSSGCVRDPSFESVSILSREVTCVGPK